MIFKRFYLLMREGERERETETEREREGETGSRQGARCGTLSGVSRIRPWAEGGAKPLSHLGCPKSYDLCICFISIIYLQNSPEM